MGIPHRLCRRGGSQRLRLLPTAHTGLPPRMELKVQRSFMQILSRPIRRNRRGYALIIILCFLVVCLIVFASVMHWITSNAYVTQRNNQYNMSESAAEAATEKVLSQMNYDYVAQSLSNSATYYATTFIPGLAT